MSQDDFIPSSSHCFNIYIRIREVNNILSINLMHPWHATIQFQCPFHPSIQAKKKDAIVSVYIKSENCGLRHEHQDADDDDIGIEAPR